MEGKGKNGREGEVGERQIERRWKGLTGWQAGRKWKEVREEGGDVLEKRHSALVVAALAFCSLLSCLQ